MSDGRSTYRVTAADGWELDVLRIPVPAPAPRLGAAVLGHAMMVDRRSMDRPRSAGFATALADAGWEVHLVDFRGRGGSGPGVAEGGSWTYDEIIAFDIPAVVGAARAPAEADGRGDRDWLWWVGHSLGGHAAMATAGSGLYGDVRPPDGHVLMSTNTWIPSLEPSWWRRRRKQGSILAFDVLRRTVGHFPARRVGFGPVDECGDYVSDIVRIWRGGRWASRDGRHDYLANLPNVRGPVLSVLGRGDRLMAHHAGATNWIGRLGEGRAEVWLVGAGDHGLTFDPDHMTVVTDDRARPLWDDVCAWMASAAQSV